jgi:cytochrome c biogenesis protein CcdA
LFNRKSNQLLYLCILLFSIIFCMTFATNIYANEDPEKTIKVHYFYMQACESCKDEEDFLKHFYEILGDEVKGVNIELKLYNTFNLSNHKVLKNFLLDFNVTEELQPSQNILFIGDKYILDNKDFNKSLKEEFIKEKSILNVNFTPKITSNVKDNDSLIVYFYVSPCSACEETESFFKKLNDSYEVDNSGIKTSSNLKIKKYNIGDLKNFQLAMKYFEIYNVQEEDQKVPILFIGDSYLQGKDDIQKSLLDNVLAGTGLYTKDLIVDGVAPEDINERLSSYKYIGVFFTGLVNGLNPCSLSMLLFFLSMIAVKNVSTLKLGIAFISGKFISYFLIGILLFNILSQINGSWFSTVQSITKTVLLLICVILIVLNIKDYVDAKNEKYGKIKLQLPVALRKLNHSWIKKIFLVEDCRLLVLVSFGLGLLISAGEFLCTGQIYLATIIYVLQTSASLNVQAIILFIIYGIALIIPLLMLTILIHKGKEIFDMSELLREKIHVIKLINAIIFIIFALLLIFLF